MDSQILLLFPFFSLTLILKISLLFQIPRCSSNPQSYHNCRDTFRCGAITGIQYPFRGNVDPDYCGYPGLVLNCDQDKNITTMEMANITYRVLGMDQATRIMKIARKDVMETACPQDLVNTTLDYELFDYVSNYINLTFLFGCPEVIKISGFNLHSCGVGLYSGAYVWPGAQGPGVCNVSVVVPVLQTDLGKFLLSPDLDQVFRVGLDVRWIVDMKACDECKKSGGGCGYDFTAKQTTCFCPDPPYMSNTCSVANGAPLGSMTVPGGKRRNTLLITISTSVSAFLVVPLLGFCICYRMRGKRTEEEKKDYSQQVHLIDLAGNRLVDGYSNENSLGEKEAKSEDFPLIRLDFIYAATQQFSEENKLGEGGFGPVYKGTLGNGKEIAVKRLSKNSGQGLHEFKNEVTSISRLQHRNLVRLLGCCLEGNELLLVYDYMPNKSLDVFLFDSTRGAQLDWKRRLSIINGIARGLLYLHEDSRLRIIHRDLKASNILLDHEMNPKISDFGMARIFGGDQSEANTNRVVGTYGYMAPEYAMEGLFSIKSDVFSFGVLLLEILSGKKNSRFYLSEGGQSLLTFAWKLWCKGKGLELMDPLLAESCVATEVLKCIHIGLLCVQEDPADRPTMSSIVLMLGSDTTTLPRPTEPAFSVGRVVLPSSQTQPSDKVCSVNEVTLSNVCPR